MNPNSDNNSSKSATNLVTGYYKELLSSFILHYENTMQQFGVEDLHKLRVEIKKLRAFYRFLEVASNNGFSKKLHFQLLSLIFKPGGRLRETQVNQNLILRYRSYQLEDFKTFLSRRNQKQTKKLHTAFEGFHISDFQQQNKTAIDVLNSYTSAQLLESAIRFIRIELDEIIKLRSSIANDEDLHQIRTHTKALGYIAKMGQKLFPDQEFDALLRIAKPTEKLIGNWHDRVVLRDVLIRYLKKNQNASDLAEAEKLIRQINSRNRASVKVIASRLNKLMEM